MSKILQFRRGTTSQLANITGAQGELFVDLTKDTLVVMDGVTQGGQPLQKELVSGQTIKTISGQSVLGSGDLDIAVSFDAILEDLVPAIGEVYDIGTSSNRWYNGYFTKEILLGNSSFIADEDSLSINTTSSILNINTENIVVSADTVISESDFIAKSLLLDDLFVIDNVLKPLKTPLYGQREIIIDGGLNIESYDAAYIKLSQLFSTNTQVIPAIAGEAAGNFSAPSSAFAFYGDLSAQLAQYGITATIRPGSTLIASPQDPSTLTQMQELIAKLPPIGTLLTITVTDWAGGYGWISGGGMSSGSITYTAVYEGTHSEDIDAGGQIIPILGILINIPENVGQASLGGPIYTYSISWNIPETTVVTEDTSILDNYGSAGMLRFNGVTNSFEGHNGTEWGPIGGGGSGIPEVSPGEFELNGNLTVTGDVTSLSDFSVKENISKITNAISIISGIDGVRYNKLGNSKTSIGLIAQNVEKYIPEVVQTSFNGLKGVSYSNIVAVLIEAIKEQQVQIDELRGRLNGI